MNGSGMGAESELSEATGAADKSNLPILVIKDKQSKTIAASFVPAKGTDPFAVKFFSNFLQRMGHRKILNKSDHEHSILALKKKAAQNAEIEAVLEEPPVGQSKSNGEIEVAVKEIKGMIRSVKSDLEHKLNFEIDRRHPILAWHVADVISRHRLGPDGRTAEKRRTGKNWKRLAFQCGELIFVHETMPRAVHQARGSYEPAMKEGRYIGHHGRTGSVLVMTPDGILRGRCRKRIAGPRKAGTVSRAILGMWRRRHGPRSRKTWSQERMQVVFNFPAYRFWWQHRRSDACT